MLRPRIIPCLLLRRGALVKTVQFRNAKYVGDPINAVRIFNEKEADELMILDIGATTSGLPPNMELIDHLASECRMPLCYGGGIRTAEQAERIVSLGVEKLAVSAAAIEDPKLVRALADAIGTQSVAAVLDVKCTARAKYAVLTHNGTRETNLDVVDCARLMEAQGAGEIIVNSIDKDGCMEGYDYAVAEAVRSAVNVPITILGGAGRLAHLEELIARVGVVGAAAGSLFVFKGSYRAVLISYIRPEDRNSMMARVTRGVSGRDGQDR